MNSFNLKKLKYYFRFPVFNYSLITFISLSTIIVLVTYISYSQLKEQKLSEIRRISISTSENISQYFRGLIINGISIINRSELKLSSYENLTPKEKSIILNNNFGSNNEFEVLVQTNERGEYTANTEWIKRPEIEKNQKGKSLADRKYFIDLKENANLEMVISEPIRSRTTGHWVVVLANRRYQKNNKFIGINVITISLKEISNFLEKANPVKDSTLTLFNHNDVLLTKAPYREDRIGQVVKLDLKHEIEKRSIQKVCPFERVEKIFGVASLKEIGVYAVWSIPYKQVLSVINGQYIIIIAIESLIFIIALIFFRFKYLNLKTLELMKINEVNNAKMILIGEFASGIAHEINNPLTVIMGHARAILSRHLHDKDETLKEKLTKILETSERISSTIKSLKNLGHSANQNEKIDYSFAKIIDDVEQIINVNIQSHNIKLIRSFSDDFVLKCNPSMLSQVFLNLFSNSIYAIKTLDEKWIEIKLVVTNDRIKIHFIDSGHGISKEVSEKLMQTFYTTKPIGEGTGLGLTICKKIINGQGGELYINSSFSNTCFTIELPLT